jgi:hypothetical protein
LFDANVLSNGSRKSLALIGEGINGPATVEPPRNGISSIGKTNQKRKLPSCFDNVDSEWTSVPDLALEDDTDLSELDDRSEHCEESSEEEEEASSCTDDCHDLAPKRKKRRRNKTERSDLIVVLDMDECMISFRTPQEEEQDQQDKESHSSGLQENPQNGPAHDSTKELDPTVAYVNGNKVLLRPGLIKFLKFVTARFQTHVFTAGTKEYADPILDKLCQLVGNTTAFSKRWYRDDCDTVEILHPLSACRIDNIYVKPLSKVAEWEGRDARDLRRIVHVDDQPRNFLLNHGNGIRVSEWRGGNSHDTVLSEVTQILQRIDTENFGDVRPHLRLESYLAIRDELDMMEFFPYKRTRGIEPLA